MSDTLFLWCDIETTGLIPYERDAQILEVAAVLTDTYLEPKWSFEACLEFSEEQAAELMQRDRFVYDMHEASGLLEDCATQGLPLETVANALQQMLETSRTEFIWGRGPLFAGSSVHFDRKWMEYYAPDVMELVHYRNFDVSSLYPFAVMMGVKYPSEPKVHRAMPDVLRSIKELEHIKSGFDWSMKAAHA